MARRRRLRDALVRHGHGRSGFIDPADRPVTHDIAEGDEAAEGLLRALNHDLRPSQLLTPRWIIGRAAAGVMRSQPTQIPTMLKEVAMEVGNQVRRSRQRRVRF
jgi:hypothetical protein